MESRRGLKKSTTTPEAWMLYGSHDYFTNTAGEGGMDPGILFRLRN